MNQNRKGRIKLAIAIATLLIASIAVNLPAESNPSLGGIPRVGDTVPDFVLTTTELKDVTLADYSGYNLILNIFPSVDTPVCAASLRQFNERVNTLTETKVLAISMDLPFAMKRHCAAMGIDNVIPLSAFRSNSFGEDYGVLIPSSPLRGLLSRAVIVVNSERKVIYSQFVFDINNEPDYDKAMDALPDKNSSE